ncbi:MAG: type II toxin-antitoxin system VapC family toxin [Candidatus Cybelea sp.]
MTIVLDASTALAAVLPDEASPFAEAAVEAGLRQGLIAPALWPYEVQNGLLVALKRKRIDDEGLKHALEVLRSFAPDLRPAQGLGVELRLGEKHELSTYDAAYVAVAIANDAALATTNRRLRAAAKAAGVRLFKE